MTQASQKRTITDGGTKFTRCTESYLCIERFVLPAVCVNAVPVVHPFFADALRSNTAAQSCRLVQIRTNLHISEYVNIDFNRF